jgi:hypothetical protein
VIQQSRFGPNWESVIREWHLGQSFPFSPDVGWRSLQDLERIWPERVDDLLAAGARGSGIIQPEIELGMTLESCEPLGGFCSLLARLKQHEKGAPAELKIAYRLLRLGYHPELEPELNGKRLDCLIHVGNEPVYVEVIAPQEADVLIEIDQELGRFAHVLSNRFGSFDLEVDLLVDPSPEACDAILQAMAGLELSGMNNHHLDGLAEIRVGNSSSGAPSYADEYSGPAYVVMAQRFGGGGSISISRVVSDDRAQKLFTQELDHFSRDHTNILIMDVTEVPDGIVGWTPLIQRRFQPTQNRRIGAVVMFEEEFIGTIQRTWQVLRNNYAYRRPPDVLLEEFGRPEA